MKATNNRTGVTRPAASNNPTFFIALVLSHDNRRNSVGFSLLEVVHSASSSA